MAYDISKHAEWLTRPENVILSLPPTALVTAALAALGRKPAKGRQKEFDNPTDVVNNAAMPEDVKKRAAKQLSEEAFRRGGLVSMSEGGTPKVSWSEARKTPERLARRAKPNLSESVISDPTRDERRSMADLVNILFGVPGAEVALARMGGLGALAGIIKPNRTFYRGVPVYNNDMNVSLRPGFVGRGKTNTGNAAWATSNPLVAETYSGERGLIMPLELQDKPVELEAAGKFWNEFFHGAEGKRRANQKILNSEFAEAMRDPTVKSVLVKNVIDPGGRGLDSVLARHQGMDYEEALQKLFLGDNLLIKDPSVVKFKATDEIGQWAQGGKVEPPSSDRQPTTTQTHSGWEVLAQ